MKSEHPAKPKRWVVLLCLLLTFACFAIVSGIETDPDLGWHLRAGELITKSGIPKQDPFSFTMPDFSWVNHEWLADVILYRVHDLGGVALTAALYGVLWTLALALALRKRWWYGFSLGILGTMPMAGPRPLVWTAIGICLTELVIEKHLSSPKTGWLRVMPVIFLAWANLHGGFALGLALMGVHAVFKRDVRIIIFLFLSALLTLINPYGIEIYTEIFRTVLDNRLGSRIMEWFPLPGISTSSFVFRAAAVYIGLSLALMWVGKINFRSYRTYIPFGALIMAVLSNRHMLIYVFTSLRAAEAGAESIFRFVSGWKKAIPAGLLLIPLIMALHYRVIPILKNRPQLDPWLSQVVSEHCSGNIFNDYNSGGYLIRNNPVVKVYIDGRMPSWENEEGQIFERYVKFQDDEKYRNSEIERYDIGCMVLSNTRKDNKTLIRSLQDQGWIVRGVRGNTEVLSRN